MDRVLNSRPGVNLHTARRITEAVMRLESQHGQAVSSRPALLKFDFILPGGPNTFMSMLGPVIN